MLVIASALAFILREIILLVSYINNNSFPKPLSAAEEKKYLEKFRKGDQAARQILIEHNLRLVAHVIKKFENTGEDKEDLISIGTIGLIKAINTYNSNKGTRLATYAARCIENEILMNLRANKKIKQEVYLQEPIGVDKEGNEITLLDILGTDTDSVIDKVDLILLEEKLHRIIKKLKMRERKVLSMRFGLEGGRQRTQKEIAQKLGISRSYVSRIEKRVLQKIAEEFQSTNNKLLP
ncbi:MAG: RNA polymerase sporulation sigma factor SigK [Dethiobacteria bacterium]|jgi:RNA polymerase sporulation-specific sigma factor